ncbi:multidrug effflux MFS transporter [Aestuariibacter salexigens]|uniref:multidrug effflux MFS transporter n=1 Tax=Aestuariibacter salexigens TaxID=226010 RepID=UPI0004077E70|nr:multidrug effflux MFS transporter [Aestuariibacter salexigens]
MQTEKPALPLPEFVALMALMTSLVALAIDAMLPALNQIGQEIGDGSQQQAHLVVSLFFAGMALGQLFFGPLSDARGRRFTILVGLAIFILGTLICMFATDMTTMLMGRFVQAFGVSGPRVASLAVIRDQYQGAAMARVMSFIMMVFILVPMAAPIIGQTVLLWFDWRQIFTLFLGVAAIAGGWFMIRQPETLSKERRIPFRFSQCMASAGFILSHKAVMGYVGAMGCIFGAFLAYLSASQTIFQTFYGLGQLFPLIFALLAFSIGLASLFNGRMVMRVGMARLCRSALIGCVFWCSYMMVLVLLFDGLPPIWHFVAVLFALFFCIGILFGNLNAMAMQPLGHVAGMGAAIIGSLSSLLSVPIAIAIDAFISTDVLPVAIGFSVFVLISWACFEFARCGEQSEHTPD